MWDIYLEKKKENNDKMYLFKSGRFYYFLGEDADIANKELLLKKTKFSKETDKCGFPENSFETYSKFLKTLKLDFEVVLNNNNQVLSDIKSLDLNKISGTNAIQKLKEYQAILER